MKESLTKPNFSYIKGIAAYMLLTLISASALFAKVNIPIPIWSMTNGVQDSLIKVSSLKDNSGNIYTWGITQTSSHGKDVLVTKRTSSGTLLLTLQYDNAAHTDDIGVSLQVDNSNNIYVLVSSSISYINNDIVVLKYNSSGTLLWQHHFDGVSHLNDFPCSIAVSSNKSIYVTGSTEVSSGNYDILIYSLAQDGNLRWNVVKNLSGNDDIGFNVQMNSTNNKVVITGITTATYPNTNYILYNLDTFGITIDSTVTAGPVIGINQVNDVKIEPSGIIVVGGTGNIDSFSSFYTLLEYDKTLHLKWQKEFSKTGKHGQLCALGYDNSGNIYACGFFTSSTTGKDIYLVKYDSSGIKKWEQSYSGRFGKDDEPTSLAVFNDTAIYILGTTADTTKNVLLLKYKTNGQLLYVKPLGNNTTSGQIVVDTSMIYVSGQTLDSIAGRFQYFTMGIGFKDLFIPEDIMPASERISYLPNSGQVRNTNDSIATYVLYSSEGLEQSVFIQQNKLTYQFNHLHNDSIALDSTYRVDIYPIGGFRSTQTDIALDQKGFLHNYYLGGMTQYVTGVFGYDRVVFPDIYTGVDWHIHNSTSGVRNYFVLNEGANLSDLRIKIDGATSSSISGSILTISTPFGNISYSISARIYNSLTSTYSPTTIASSLGTDHILHFTGTTSGTSKLIIELNTVDLTSATTADLKNIEWCSFFGNESGKNATGTAIALDPIGAQYMTGEINGVGFAPSTGLFLFTSHINSYLVKFDDTHHAINWATYYGSVTGFTRPNDIITTHEDPDKIPKIYIGGTFDDTPDQLPLRKPVATSFQGPRGYITASTFGFVARFLGDDGTCDWSTTIGGSIEAGAIAAVTALAMVNNNELIIGGWAKNYVFCDVINMDDSHSFYDAHTNHNFFLGRFSSDCELRWGTRFGGEFSTSDFTDNNKMMNRIYSITSNTQGDIILCGTTENAVDYPTPAGPSGSYVHSAYTASGFNHRDGFIAKFQHSSPSTGIHYYNLYWSTLFGGNGNDFLRSTKTDAAGNIYVVGSSNSTDIPVYTLSTSAYTEHSLSGDYDGLLLKFDANGVPKHSTYFGGDKADQINDIVLDKDENIFICGKTLSNPPLISTFPVLDKPDFYSDLGRSSASNEGFLAKFENNLSEFWCSYFGGVGESFVSDLCYYNNSTFASLLYFSGTNTQLPEFPVKFKSAAWNDDLHAGAYIGYFDLYYIYSSVNQVNTDRNVINVYPNPAGDLLRISLSNKLQGIMKIYTILGEEIFNSKVDGLDTEVNTQNFKSGIYVIKYLSYNNECSQAKVVITH
jgi:Secretion system C-terminal sorting domain/Beta-propeller repeat